ncbi:MULTISPECIES: CatB-related O-acetyltransferase [Bacteroidales]|jgi:acetyltransferase-like isoleucine patch superfamily enzyme|nr:MULTISPECIES: CatB-related O-acetyltransferase [Bacteroidales]ROS87707.1 antibiotic acetyltransferase [Muribaculaceae bacterium Isolate-080 (Janvier)]
MRYLKLLGQLILNIFNPAISIFSRVECSTVSSKAKIYRGVKLDNSKIGDYTYVGPYAKIVYANIGKFCSIAAKSFIGLPTHPISLISSSPIFISPVNATGFKWTSVSVEFEEYKQVNIGNDVWIGANAMILGGITIGDGAIIGAGAVVTKDIPPYAIVGGIPARIIRYRFPNDVINALLSSQWWNLSENILKSNIKVFQSNDFINHIDGLFNT